MVVAHHPVSRKTSRIRRKQKLAACSQQCLSKAILLSPVCSLHFLLIVYHSKSQQSVLTKFSTHCSL